LLSPVLVAGTADIPIHLSDFKEDMHLPDWGHLDFSGHSLNKLMLYANSRYF